MLFLWFYNCCLFYLILESLFGVERCCYTNKIGLDKVIITRQVSHNYEIKSHNYEILAVYVPLWLRLIQWSFQYQHDYAGNWSTV